MKKPLATHSTNCLAVAGKLAAGGLAMLVMLSVARTTHAQTSATLRSRAIAQWTAPRPIDKARLTRHGFRVLEGRHVTIVTDLPSVPEVDELPTVIDAAVPLLAKRFNVNDRAASEWHVLAMLLTDRDKFDAAGLMPKGNEQFPDGLSIGYELWVADQPSAYYRRHLLLHELVHSFMATQLGGCGPGWYMEGMAELLGTHTWHPRTRSLKLGVMPANRDVVPMWGRTKLVREAVTADRLLSIASVMQIDNRQALEVESYAWVWALAKFLDTHPQYQQRFRELQSHTLDRNFNARFRRSYEQDWSNLTTEWRLFATNLTYGHDIEREAIAFPQQSDSLRQLDTPRRINVSASQGWQSTGLLLESGTEYEIKASGRFVVGKEPDGTPWPCEPGGITLDYHAGHPLGKLLAVVDDRQPTNHSEPPAATSAFLHPVPIGLKAKLTPQRNGVLYLRVNDSPAGLDDNRGNVAVTIRQSQ